jgi:alanyl-tRNA synthetase
MVKLLSESSIGSGVRRVEGLVGLDAYRYLAKEHVLLSQLASTFKVPADEVPDRVAAALERLRDAEKELGQLKAGAVLQQAAQLAAAAQDLGGLLYVGVEVPAGTPGELLRTAAAAVDGKGGGKDDVAQGGGTNPAGIGQALALGAELVRRTAGS